jgi:hypothetical protein
MRVDGVTYRFTRGSDINRDGMYLECERVDAGGEKTLVLEAFWHDPTGRFTVRTFVDELPFALVQAFVRKAAEGCPPIESKDAGTKVLVYVKLLDEDVDVWRPVSAEVASDGSDRLAGDRPDDERWEFEPGMSVACEARRLDDGTLGLVATKRAG